MKFSEIFNRNWDAITAGIISGLSVYYGLKIKSGLISAFFIFLCVLILNLIYSFFVWEFSIKNKVKPKKRNHTKKKFLTFFLLKCVIILIILAPIVVFIKWNFTNYHEKGHLDSCQLANISCDFKNKSFIAYSSFVFNNIKQGKWVFAEMSIEPRNTTEFCNLDFDKQQIIRLGGFRNDSKVLLWLSLTLTIELLLFLGFVLFLITQKKSISLKWVLLIILIICITSLLLYNNIIQFKGYIGMNFGDLFFNPCI